MVCGQKKWEVFQPPDRICVFIRIFRDPILTHRILVWYIYLHLADLNGTICLHLANYTVQSYGLWNGIRNLGSSHPFPIDFVSMYGDTFSQPISMDLFSFRFTWKVIRKDSLRIPYINYTLVEVTWQYLFHVFQVAEWFDQHKNDWNHTIIVLNSRHLPFSMNPNETTKQPFDEENYLVNSSPVPNIIDPNKEKQKLL